ncbi:MAG TPA: DUF6572 domain-containing protein [Candidatus Acidoferrum sp.]|nr:DUF6572 domain-containing protein [Candidatus Acidoferrum sp.]
MTVEETKLIDIISTDKRGRVNLTISDHLDWKDSEKHQRILQAKLNAYLAFVESGELLEQYPDAKNRKVIFTLASKFQPDFAGRKFLNRARKIIKSAGFDLRYKLFAQSYDN